MPHEPGADPHDPSSGSDHHYSLGDIHVGVFVEVGINVAVDGTFVHVGGMVDVLIGLGKMLLKLLVIVAELIEDLFALAKSRVTRSLRTEECQQYLHLEACPTEP